jgi:predicted DNA-binding antitoxin AbrB/MazE fold protein
MARAPGVIAMSNIHAIYENGVFRPVEPVSLPERCEVEVEIRAMKTETQEPSLDDVYAILGKRSSSGEHDVAARHNEHQP